MKMGNNPDKIFLTLTILLSLIVLCAFPLFAQSGNQIFFSPNASPGVKDKLIFELEGMGDDTWNAYITNENGDTVWEMQWEGSPNKYIEWFGTDNEGNYLPDGPYAYHIYGQDLAGNEVNQHLTGLIIDNTPPTIEASTEYYFISPQSSPGVQDNLVFSHEGTGEDTYQAIIYNAMEQEVWKTSWTGNPNHDVLWRGTNQAGEAVAEGEYKYVIRASDRAGNTDESIIPGIIVDNTPPQLTINVDFKQFSPNGDDERDYVTFSNAGQGADRWEISIKNSEGETVWYSEYIDNPLPPTLQWEGVTENGDILPDDAYEYIVEGKDKAGNSISKSIRNIILDNTPPSVQVRVRASFLSPNNDDKFDDIAIENELEEIDRDSFHRAVITIYDEIGTPIVTETYRDSFPENYVWDGKDENGNTMPDGLYHYEIVTIDKARNQETTILEDILIITAENTAFVQVNREYFSPKKKILKAHPLTTQY